MRKFRPILIKDGRKIAYKPMNKDKCLNVIDNYAGQSFVLTESFGRVEELTVKEFKKLTK